MRRVVRVLAGVNAVYQGLAGLLCIISPPLAAQAFKIGRPAPVDAALLRIAGGLLVGNALWLGLLARGPEAHPLLAPLVIAGCIVNLASDVTIVLAGDMGLDQLGAGMALQVLLVAALAAGFSSGALRAPRQE
jgi:hypothetical protein